MNITEYLEKIFGNTEKTNTLLAEVKVARDEVTSLQSKLADAEAKVKERELTIMELEDKVAKSAERVTTLEAEVAALPEKIDKRATEIATEKLASAGAPAAAVAGDVADIGSVIESYMKEKDPVKRAVIYQQHRAEIEKKVLGR